jgi:hypothetical protein
MSVERTNMLAAFDTAAVESNLLIAEVNATTEEQVERPDDNKNRTEMRSQEQKKDDGGCMKIFSMILQIVAAVVAAVGGPKGMAIAAALTAAAKAIKPNEAEASGNGSKPADLNGARNTIDDAADRLRPQYLPQPPVRVA